MPSQTLSMNQQQQLQMVLAPQLRQSLEMLQVPILELQAMIQKELEQNPTLEEGPKDGPTVEVEPASGEKEGETELDFNKDIEALAQLDDEWKEYFLQDRQNRPYSEEDSEKRQYLIDSVTETESLQQHLLDQLRLSGISEPDKQIGELIIGSINEDGYLATPMAELASSAGCDILHLEDILSVVQDFHPTGIGARDLRECLLIQLERLGSTNPLAATLVREHLDQLGARRYSEIAKALNVSPVEVQNAAKLIATLDPKPGRIYNTEVANYVVPEVVVQKIDGKYVVILNDDQLPHVRISKHYRQLLEEAGTTAEVKSYIREKIRAGAFLIRSIHQRQKTIYRIASEIVTEQTAFLDHGISRLRPLTMAEIASKVGVHETTVSRAVSGKYMQSPIGVFELKYFFTPGLKTAGGAEISNKTVKDIIGGMVANEDPGNPLSDQEIMAKLQEQGIDIARRTVAKYRLVLHIPPSHLRRIH